MNKILFSILSLTLLATAGCASTWSMVVIPPAEPSQWLDDANVARATYLGSISGFTETGSSFSNVLRYIAFGGRAEDNTIKRPVAAAIGGDGRIAIADIACACVHLYIPGEHAYRKIYGARKEELKVPVSVAFGNEERLYVSDSAMGAIQVFDREGAHLFSITQAGDDTLQRPTGLSFAPAGNILFAVDTLANRVHAFSPEGVLLYSFGEWGELQGQFNFPTHIAAAPDGRLYVTDAMNFRVQVFDLSGAFESSFGHHGNGSGDFSLPKGLAVDKAGVIYVVDSLFDNIQLFSMSGEFLFTIGKRGTGSSEFWLPSGAFLDNQDKLYVSDTFNQRVQIFQLSRVSR